MPYAGIAMPLCRQRRFSRRHAVAPYYHSAAITIDAYDHAMLLL